MKLFSEKTKKRIAVTLAASFVGTFGFCFASAQTTDVDYKITSPYTSVNWDAVKQYKGDLHCHTTASDGDDTLQEMVERHYELGFDYMAVTDHGTVDLNWTDGHVDPDLKIALSIKEGEVMPIVPLEEQGTAANGKAYTLTTENGNDYYQQTGGQKMLRVPFGNENNAASFNNTHINSWFVPYGDGMLSGTCDYRTALNGISKAGATCVINHPGEYTNARDEVYAEDAYDRNDFHYNYVINKFENLMMDYDCCIGIDINSKGDWRTRFDRQLWDAMLEDLTPQGRTVFAIASTDAHNLDIVNSGYTLSLLENLTAEDLRTSLQNGTFFAASRYVGNRNELNGYAEAMLQSNDKEINDFGKEIEAIVEKIDREIEENGEQSSKFEAAVGEAIPSIEKIEIDDTEDTITIDCENAMLVSWIADGEVIATGNTIDLDDYSDEIGSYVRAEVFNRGGIVYTQAFTLEYDGAPDGAFNDRFIDLGTGIGRIIQILLEVLTAGPLFDIIWNVFYAAK